LDAIAEAIEQHQRFLVATHVRPDGDAVGSLLAMTRLLQRMHKSADPFCQDPVPPGHDFLAGVDQIRSEPARGNHYQVAVLVDCGDYTRVGPTLASLIKDISVVINIDHHLSKTPFGSIHWVDPKASSTCELLYLLARRLQLELDPELATQLYTGLLTDTGSFRYSNTNHRALEIASQLAAAGAEPAAIAEQVYESASPQRLHLLAQVLAGVQFFQGDRLAAAELTQKMIAQSGASQNDSEGFIDLLRAVKPVQIAVLFRENPDGLVHVSLRSKGDADVAAFARRYNGGGHRNAAAFRVQSDLQLAKVEILQQLMDTMS
jgi:phosphoesterase RecJ-like protein